MTTLTELSTLATLDQLLDMHLVLDAIETAESLAARERETR